jgi:hypothetical protein
MSVQSERIPYKSDLSNEQWEIVKPHISTPRTNRVKSAFIPTEKS